MSQKQWKRLDVVRRWERGELTGREAAQVVGLSERQIRRLRRAVEERGRAGVVHGNTGRRPTHRISDATRKLVIELARKKYAGFNDHHLTEKLVEVEGVSVSRRSVQRILRGGGIGAIRKHRPARHRKRRERKAAEGMMALWDGSPHDWLEGRGPELCLMGAVDDATGALLPGARFVEHEGTAGYLGLLKGMIEGKGIPLSIYMDKHSALRRNDDHWTLEEELTGEQELTQVGRALRELGVEIIYAHSPQAKGRVERRWQMDQDRLCSELRQAGATNAVQANAVLERYRVENNRRFAVPARERVAVWRPMPKGLDLDRICSFRYEAKVDNDNTVRVGGRVLDIPPGPGKRGYAKARVQVHQLLDGSWRIYFKDKIIGTASATEMAELRALPRRRRPAASRVFRKALKAA
jgi:transposase